MSTINLAEDVMSLSDAKRRFHEICQRTSETGRSVLLTRHGRGIVALVPIDEFVMLTELRKELELSRALQQAKAQALRGETHTVEDVEAGLSKYLDG